MAFTCSSSWMKEVVTRLLAKALEAPMYLKKWEMNEEGKLENFKALP